MRGRRADEYAYFASPFTALAHRGGITEDAPAEVENSLRGFRAAWNYGFTHLETDVHVTSDGTLVAFHDAVLDRVTDAAGRLGDLPWSAVSGARIGGSEPIPTLDELLDALPHARFNIDLKAPSTVPATVELLERTGAHDRVLIGSFHEPTLRRFRRAVSRPVPTAVGVATVVALRFAPYPLAASRLLRDSGSVLQVPVRNRGISVLDRRLLELAHATGRHVHAWTVDERDEIERLLDMGVDGIITDRTDVLADVLRERGIWSTQR